VQRFFAFVFLHELHFLSVGRLCGGVDAGCPRGGSGVGQTQGTCRGHRVGRAFAGCPRGPLPHGKAQLDQGNYAAALKALEPLAQPSARFARAADAAYLSAVAAARLKQWAEAEQLLNLLRTEYPTYPNLRRCPVFARAGARSSKATTTRR
jgi:hypothetical protein